MINDDYSKLKYNNKLVNYLKIAYMYLESEGYKAVAYKYDWNKQKGTKIYKLNEFEETKKEKNKWINYYWIEFTKDGEEYKFSLFYKDFDAGSGNIHVLPGAIQLWKKKKDIYNSLEECKKIPLQKTKKGEIILNPIVYSEDEWYPQLDSEQIHYISDEKDLNAVLEIIIKKDLEKIEEKNEDKIKKQLLGTISEEVNFYTFGDKIDIIKREEGLENSSYNINRSDYRYYAIKWFQIDNYWISFYFSEENINKIIYPKFGQIQFWRGISAKPCSPSEYKEEKWTLFYPETSNPYKIIDIRNWVANGEETKIREFIEETKTIEKIVKSFDPDINIENKKDMKRLDKDFNEFKRICNIIENNIEKSVEEILKLILGK